jgi:hypothetical protein
MHGRVVGADDLAGRGVVRLAALLELGRGQHPGPEVGAAKVGAERLGGAVLWALADGRVVAADEVRVLLMGEGAGIRIGVTISRTSAAASTRSAPGTRVPAAITAVLYSRMISSRWASV